MDIPKDIQEQIDNIRECNGVIADTITREIKEAKDMDEFRLYIYADVVALDEFDNFLLNREDES